MNAVFRWLLAGWIIFSVGFAFAQNGHAETAMGEKAGPMTLSDAVGRAVEQNPAVAAVRSEGEMADARLVQARSGFFPQIFLTESFNRTNNPMWAFGTKLNQAAITPSDFDPNRLNHPDGINNFASVLNADWMIYNGGQTRTAVQQAETFREIADLKRVSVVQQVVAETAAAYVGLMMAIESRGVVAQARDTARAHLDLVESRFNSGMVVKSDLLRAQVRIAELEQELLRAHSGMDVAAAFLCTAMGESVDCGVEPVTPLARCVDIQDGEPVWIERALAMRPDLSMLRLNLDILQGDVDKSRAAHLPTVSLTGSYGLDSEDFGDFADSYTVGAVARINLFSGHRIAAETVEKKAAVRNLEALIRKADLAVRVQTKQALLEAKSAWKQIRVASAAVSQAEETLRIVRNRYRGGMLTIVALLDAEVALQQAQHRHFQAMHDYKKARINLHLAAGTIDSTFQ